jgi:cyclophilin family peptidyl-prolyl cis-trans isomerase
MLWMVLLMAGFYPVQGRTPPPPAGVIAKFETSVGVIEVELVDEKPETTKNFIRYGEVKGWTNGFMHRWATNADLRGFVLQGGGFYIETNTINPVKTFPPIVNEFNVGPRLSNTNGTIAMARSTGVNSATSQWFFNLGDNSANLDNQNGGFTVFGRVISGMNVLNRFVPPIGTQGIWRADLGFQPMRELPILENTLDVGIEDLIYARITFRRYLGFKISRNAPGENLISFKSVPGTTNVVEFSNTLPPTWTKLTNWVATTTNSTAVLKNRTAPFEIYRIRVDY